MNDVLNTSGFLRTSRSFPEDPKLMQSEMNRSYVDLARGINNRTIGFFPVNRSVANGEQWFITKNQRQQALREVYQWNDSNLIINHGINFMSLTNLVRFWGTFFDGTYWQNLPYVDITNVTNQIMIEIDKDNIYIQKGGGSPPNCANGLVIVEWLSNP